MWRAARCLRPCDRLSSSLSVMLLQLRIRRNEQFVVIVYSLKSRAIVWRAARYLRPCDRLSNTPSGTPRYLKIGKNEIDAYDIIVTS